MDATQATATGLINLDKDQKIDLTKTHAALLIIGFGLGWNVRSTQGEAFDLDACILCLRNGKWNGSQGDLMFWGSPATGNTANTSERGILGGAVLHSGDNLTGAGDGDDEVLSVELSKIPADVTELIQGIVIHQAAARGQNFGKVNGAYCRIFDKQTGEEIAKYDLSEDYSGATLVVVGKMYRHNNEWKYQAIGTGMTGDLNSFAASFSN